MKSQDQGRIIGFVYYRSKSFPRGMEHSWPMANHRIKTEPRGNYKTRVQYPNETSRGVKNGKANAGKTRTLQHLLLR